MHTGRGGPRPGAGRPRKLVTPIYHIRRDNFSRRNPGHVTLRVRKEIPSLRKRGFIKAFRKSLSQACERGNFRVVHYSIQTNHVHLLVEAGGKEALERGMMAVGTRLVHAVHRVYKRRGPVLHGRYHVRSLKREIQERWLWPTHGY